MYQADVEVLNPKVPRYKSCTLIMSPKTLACWQGSQATWSLWHISSDMTCQLLHLDCAPLDVTAPNPSKLITPVRIFSRTALPPVWYYFCTAVLETRLRPYFFTQKFESKSSQNQPFGTAANQFIAGAKMQCLQFIFNETHWVPAAGNDNQSWNRLNFLVATHHVRLQLEIVSFSDWTPKQHNVTQWVPVVFLPWDTASYFVVIKRFGHLWGGMIPVMSALV